MDVKFYRWIIGTLLLLISLLNSAYAGEVVFKGTDVPIGRQVEILEDTSAALTFDEVKARGKFTPSSEDTPNFGVSASTFWIRLNIRNNSAEDNLFLEPGLSPHRSRYIIFDRRRQNEIGNDFLERRIRQAACQTPEYCF
jgi:hypothetical protein